MTDAKSNLEALRAELAEKHVRVLSTPEGRELLALLERRFFNGPIWDPDPSARDFNLGAREVVRVLRDFCALIEKKERSNG